LGPPPVKKGAKRRPRLFPPPVKKSGGNLKGIGQTVWPRFIWKFGLYSPEMGQGELGLKAPKGSNPLKGIKKEG